MVKIPISFCRASQAVVCHEGVPGFASKSLYVAVPTSPYGDPDVLVLKKIDVCIQKRTEAVSFAAYIYCCPGWNGRITYFTRMCS
jgi:hypothetical protein